MSKISIIIFGIISFSLFLPSCRQEALNKDNLKTKITANTPASEFILVDGVVKNVLNGQVSVECKVLSDGDLAERIYPGQEASASIKSQEIYGKVMTADPLVRKYLVFHVMFQDPKGMLNSGESLSIKLKTE